MKKRLIMLQNTASFFKKLCLSILFVFISCYLSAVNIVNPSYQAVIRSMFFDSNNTLWIGTFGSGLWCVKGETAVKALDKAGKQPVNRVSKVIVRGGEILVAAAGEGLQAYSPESQIWKEFQPSPGNDFQFLHGLADTSEGLLIGSVGSYSAVFKNGSWKKIAGAQRLEDDWINDFLQVSDGVWFAGGDGIWKLQNGKISEYYVPRNEWIDPEVNVLALWNDTLFLGTSLNGLIYLDKKNNSFLSVGQISGTVSAFQIFNNNLLIGGKSGLFEISMAENGKFSVKKLNLVVSGKTPHVKSLAVSSGGKLFAGTMNGEILESSDCVNFSIFGSFRDSIFYMTQRRN
ncbi:MAG: hypothetical protein HQM10_11835 [Candidatus Riflebacteria bacterium]|nr:hypothetical protein [Candidatus Riflebacteria bacterium]